MRSSLFRAYGQRPGRRVGRSAGFLIVTAALSFLVFSRLSAGNQGHAASSPGPLSRAHSTLEGAANCQKCHTGKMEIDSERCLACHQPISQRIAAKKGVHREVGGDCEACHQEHGGVDVDIRPLDPKDFDHAAETDFALLGNHAALANNCPVCHKTRSYLSNQAVCSSCHSDPHQGGMVQRCDACHTPAGWRSVSRAFHKAGTFPLDGRHLEVPCASCHLNGVYKGTPMRCYDCHWIRRQDDRYRTALGNECEECHRPTAWTAVRWNHAVQTGVALNAAHQNLSCDNCHQNGNFRQANFLCYSCHREDYEETSDPNHVRANFPTSCELCHLPSHSDWDQARFDHNTTYPLAGVHATQSCGACHKGGVYSGTPRDCYGCHRTDYERTNDPNHISAGFPTTCEACHRPSDSSWDQARFDHNSAYPLAGVHATQSCGACHKGGVYSGTPRDCYGCHRADYERTTDPNHTNAGFPTACEACHGPSDSSWDQARFNHVWFPISSGRHAGNTCSACHPDKNNFQVFSCLTCHSRGDTDEHHRGVSGYSYASQACYSCHPQGRS